MINKIGHYSLENPASIFDEEAMTALELAGRTAAKVNEVVESQNELEQETTERLTKMEKVQIPAEVKAEVLRHIENGDFDAAIDKYTSYLSNRVDNLAAAVTPGSTSGDAELIDARMTQDGQTWNNTGNHLRAVEALADILTGSGNMTGQVIDTPIINGWVDYLGEYHPNSSGTDTHKCIQIDVEPGEMYLFYSEYGYNMPMAVAQEASGAKVHVFNHYPEGRKTSNFSDLVTVPDKAEKLTVNCYDGAGRPLAIIKVTQARPSLPEDYVKNALSVLSGISKRETELEATAERTARALRAGREFSVESGDPQFIVREYKVEQGKIYRVRAGASFTCHPFLFLDELGRIVHTPHIAPANEYRDYNEEIVAPPYAVTCLVANYGGRKPALCSVTADASQDKPWAGLKWLVIGDSITERNHWTTKNYYDYISEKTGISVTVRAWGGMGFGRRVNGECFLDKVRAMPDGEHFDVVTIMGSFNDLGAGAADGIEDTWAEVFDPSEVDEYSVDGRMILTLDELRVKYPFAAIGVISPAPWGAYRPDRVTPNALYYCGLHSPGTQVPGALIRAASTMGMAFCNLWEESGLAPWNSSLAANQYGNDANRVHPNEEGHRIMSAPILNFIKKIMGGI